MKRGFESDVDKLRRKAVSLMKKTDKAMVKRNLKEIGKLSIEAREVFSKVMDLEFRVGLVGRDNKEKDKNEIKSLKYEMQIVKQQSYIEMQKV